MDTEFVLSVDGVLSEIDGLKRRGWHLALQDEGEYWRAWFWHKKAWHCMSFPYGDGLLPAEAIQKATHVAYRFHAKYASHFEIENAQTAPPVRDR